MTEKYNKKNTYQQNETDDWQSFSFEGFKNFLSNISRTEDQTLQVKDNLQHTKYEEL